MSPILEQSGGGDRAGCAPSARAGADAAADTPRIAAWGVNSAANGAAIAQAEFVNPRGVIDMGGQGLAGSAGAPSSLRAPANSNCTILRHGIDSLYVSYPGKLHGHQDERLRALKERAQSPDEVLAAGAQLHLGEHLFAVLDRGRRKFAYVLEDNWYSLSVSSQDAGALPMAHVQISSELITKAGVPEALRQLGDVVSRLGHCSGPPKVSRVDLFADFLTSLDFESISKECWVKRARKRALYHEADAITGMAFGLGGSVSARIYNKLLELLKSHKDYLRPLWTEMGWDGSQPVWRLEFQIKRDVLPEMLVNSTDKLLAATPAIWEYLTTEWLRLAIPNPSDDTRARWPMHPVWEVLTKLDLPAGTPSLERVSKSRAPSDETLFKNGLWGLTSFMAREGITDYSEGLANFLRQAEHFHSRNSDQHQAEQLENYIQRKVLAKGRRFNTFKTNHEPE